MQYLLQNLVLEHQRLQDCMLKVLKECRRLSKGQLFEIDGSTFYGLSKIDAYLMIDELFKTAR